MDVPVTATYWDDAVGKEYQYTSNFELEVLCDLLKNNSESIFEVSTGSGIIPTILRRKGYDGKYLGSDYAQIFLDSAKEHNPNEEFIYVDLLKDIDLPDKSFDSTVLHHGIEYIYPYENGFKEIARVTKKFFFLSIWFEMGEGDRIRPQVIGDYNANFYDKQTFINTALKYFSSLAIEAKVYNAPNKVNHWLIFKV